MPRFHVIAGSSSGNCALLETEGANILIDAGLGIRKLEAHLREIGMGMEDIDAAFITHEHIDHCRALQSFFRHPHIKVLASRPTSEAVKCYVARTKELDWASFSSGDTFEFMGMEVSAFPIPHDTSDAVGYSFKIGGRTLVCVTDLGKVTHLVREKAKQASVLMLESNYCPAMLESSSRPYELKRRISGVNGHLSNESALELLSELDAGALEKVYLSHLSKECNSASRVAELLRQNLSAEMFAKIEIVCPFKGKSGFCEF